MVFLVLGYFGHAVDEINRFRKVVELESALDVLLLQLPFRDLFQAGFRLVCLEQLSHNRERVTPSSLFATENPRPLFAPKRTSYPENFAQVFRGIENLDGTIARLPGKPWPRLPHFFDGGPGAFQVADKTKAAFGREEFS